MSNQMYIYLFQVGSVCHLVQSEETESRVCSVDSLRTSVLLGLLNQIMEVKKQIFKVKLLQCM